MKKGLPGGVAQRMRSAVYKDENEPRSQARAPTTLGPFACEAASKLLAAQPGNGTVDAVR
jgi:hypothetical protein